MKRMGGIWGSTESDKQFESERKGEPGIWVSGQGGPGTAGNIRDNKEERGKHRSRER